MIFFCFISYVHKFGSIYDDADIVQRLQQLSEVMVFSGCNPSNAFQPFLVTLCFSVYIL
jgi:hypothetical protein